MSAGVSVAGQNRAQLSGGGISLDVQETHSGGGNTGYSARSQLGDDARDTGSKRVRGMGVAEKNLYTRLTRSLMSFLTFWSFKSTNRFNIIFQLQYSSLLVNNGIISCMTIVMVLCLVL